MHRRTPTSYVLVENRQVKMIHKGRLADDDLQQCVIAIRKNTVECMQGVLRAMDTFQISLGLAENAPRKKVRSDAEPGWVGCGMWDGWSGAGRLLLFWLPWVA